jgi:arylsulfatase
MKYNILFIMADQLRWDGLGKTGGWIKTPALDQLADEGITFSNCMTNSPVCSPTRVSLATGQYPHNTGVWRNITGYDMHEDTPTFMQAIRNAGYRTSLIGKAHLHRHDGDLREREPLMHTLGFDDLDEVAGPRASSKVLSYMTEEWEQKGVWEAYKQDVRDRFNNKPYVARPTSLPLELYYDVYVGRKAKEYISNYNGEQPWFIQVGFTGPHEPWDAPEPYASMYDPSQMPAPIKRDRFKDSPNRPSGNLDSLMAETTDHSPPLTEDEISKMRANYAGNMTLIDQQIGEIIQALKDKNIYDQTVIVFCSDHGEMNGDYGLIYKENFFNGAVKIPLLIRTPEIQNSERKGSVCEEMVELLDLGPTMVDFSEGRIDYQQFGKSLAGVLENPHQTHREEAVSEHKGEIMLATKEWKIVFNQQGEPYLLFHLTEDPNELLNLIGDPQFEEVVADLNSRLIKRLLTSQKFQFHDRPDSVGIEHLLSGR